MSTGIRPRPRPAIEAVAPYAVAQTAPVKLNQNESPYDWPAEIKGEVLARVSARSWNRYPTADATPLREALAAFCGVAPEQVAMTNGSNEAILALMLAFALGRTLAFPVPGYSMVPTLAAAAGASVARIPLRAGFDLDAARLLESVRGSDAAMVFLASPNNPTGNAFAREAVEEVIVGTETLVVIDEAYAAYVRPASPSWAGVTRDYPHVAVLRTFSKAFALAGMRVGWIVADAAIIASVRKVLPPYTLDLFAQEAALAALRHADLLAGRIDLAVAERDRMAGRMAAIPGIVPHPSDANFILFAATTVDPGTLFAALLERGILVRDMSRVAGLERCLRVTVGTPEENDRFLEALAAAMEALG